MALKEELKEQEKTCVDVKDYVNLAIKALEEPSDVDYARELLETAEEECKFPDEYIAVAEVYARLNDFNKAEELYETAEENAFEPLEYAKLAHSIFTTTRNTDKAQDLYKNSIKESKKLQELIEILSLLLTDFPENDIMDEVVKKISSSIKNLEDLKNVLNELKTKDKILAIKIVKEYEKKVDGIEQIVAFANLLSEFLSEKDWSKQLLEDAIEEAKFTKEFILLAKAFQSLGDNNKVNELLQQARDFAVSGEENLELAFAVWDLQKDKNLVTTLLQKSFKNIKNRMTLTELVVFSKEKIDNPELAKEILNYLIQNPSSYDELLKNIILGFEVLKDSSLSAQHFMDTLNILNEPRDLITFGIEYYKIFGDRTNTNNFFEKALKNSTKFEQYVEIAKKYYQILGGDEFVTTCLKNCEQISNSTSEFIELAKLYYELLNDNENSKRCLEYAEEIVASLQDIKIVVENVKKYFPNDENWLQRVEDKLRKREANQNKYDEFLKLEKDARYLNDYLELVDKIVEELDDIYYAKKLLYRTYDLLDKQYLNVENYYKLCKSILKTTNDVNWVVNILNSLYKHRIRFINELSQLLYYVKILIPDKETIQNLIQIYINGWKRRIKDFNEAIKLSKLMLNLEFPQSEIENFLADSLKNEGTFERLYSSLEFSLKSDLNNLTKTILEKIWETIKNSEEIISLTKLLLNHNFKEEDLIPKYFEFAQKVQSTSEIVTLAENYSKLFGSKNLDSFLKISQKRLGEKYDLFEKIYNIVVEGKYW